MKSDCATFFTWFMFSFLVCTFQALLFLHSCAFSSNLASGNPATFVCDFPFPLRLYVQKQAQKMAFFAFGNICWAWSLFGSCIAVQPQCMKALCVYEIKHKANTFLLPLSCSRTSLSCVPLCVSLLPTFSAFTLVGGCAIINRDQWWPCPCSSWSWQHAVVGYCTVPHLSFIGFLYVHECVFTVVVVHIWSLFMSRREPGLERRRPSPADETIESRFGCNCLTNVGEKGQKWGIWNAKQTQIKLCLTISSLPWYAPGMLNSLLYLFMSSNLLTLPTWEQMTHFHKNESSAYGV